MRSAAIFMTLAFATTALCTNLEPAFATKMDGRCCQWSDGGRSFRYRFATMRTEFPDVVRAHTVSCVNRSWNSMDAMRMCLRTHVAPLLVRPVTATNGI